MKMTRTLSAVRLAGIAAALPLMALAAPTISDLTVIPIPSWGLAIGYTVSGATADDADAPLVVTATGVGTNYTATTLYGDKSCVNGSHYVFWQTSKDGIAADVSNGTLRVWYPLRYCVIDLDTGASSAVNVEPSGGFNTDEYKTSKLVLKRVSDADPFYMGPFEVTAGQWSRVLATNPDFSYSANDLASVMPVGSVSYVDICGDGVSDPIPGYPDPPSPPSYPKEEVAKYEAEIAALRAELIEDAQAVTAAQAALDEAVSDWVVATNELAQAEAALCVFDLDNEVVHVYNEGRAEAASIEEIELELEAELARQKRRAELVQAVEDAEEAVEDAWRNIEEKQVALDAALDALEETAAHLAEARQRLADILAAYDAKVAEYEAMLAAIAAAKAELAERLATLKRNSFLVRLAGLTGQSLSLPTIAQWERACRADGASVAATDDSAWHSGNSDGQAQAVGQKSPNAWGLYDMLGNAWEWCGDLETNEWFSAGSTDSGVDFSASLCGGSWQKSADDCASTARTQSETSTSEVDYGFRLVRNAAETLSAIDCFAVISNVCWQSVAVDADAAAESSQVVKELLPVVAGDTASATVTGDAETGFVVTPSEDATAVVVTIPSGVDAESVTVEVSPETKTVMSNGAKIRVVRNGTNITDFLKIPSEVGGVIDLSAATVKDEIAKAVLSVADGAEIDLSAENPVLTTARTKPGLKYQLYEGEMLSDLKAGDSTVGDGKAWTPTLSVTGGTSGFYTIQVTK